MTNSEPTFTKGFKSFLFLVSITVVGGLILHFIISSDIMIKASKGMDQVKSSPPKERMVASSRRMQSSNAHNKKESENLSSQMKDEAERIRAQQIIDRARHGLKTKQYTQ